MSKALQVTTISYALPDRQPRDFAGLMGQSLAKKLGAEHCTVHPGTVVPWGAGAPLPYDCCVLVHNAANEFVVVDNQDAPCTVDLLRDLDGFRGALVGQWAPEKMRQMFGPDLAGGLVEPGFYAPGYPEAATELRAQVQKRWRQVVRRDFYEGCEYQRLFFSGSITRWPGGAREVARILRDEWPRDVAVFDGLLPREQWLLSAAERVLSLVLPLASNLSWRDMDLLGAGLPFVSIEYTNRLRDPLVPDVHYVAVRGVPVNPLSGVNEDPALAAEQIVERHREARIDSDMLLRMSDEAMAWYDRAADPAAVAERVAAWCADRMEV